MQAIIAIDNNNGMAKNGKIPWYSKKDLAFFKAQTLNNVIIMGSSTFMSLPNSEPLKNRLNIVITKNANDYNLRYIGFDNIVFLNEEELFGFIKDPYTLIRDDLYKYLKKDFVMFVIGGNQIYNMLIPYCKTVWLTRIKNNYDCDLIFNANMTNFNGTETIYDDEDISIFRMTR